MNSQQDRMRLCSKQATGKKGAELYMPLRAALTPDVDTARQSARLARIHA